MLFFNGSLETVNPDKDTTYILMLEAQARGYAVYYCDKYGITRCEDKMRFHVKKVAVHQNESPLFTVQKSLF